MAVLVDELWVDPVLVAFGAVPIRGIFRHQNDAWMRFTNPGLGPLLNAVNLDTGVIAGISDSELVEEIAAKIVPV